jgi:hypothetical protein
MRTYLTKENGRDVRLHMRKLMRERGIDLDAMDTNPKQVLPVAICQDAAPMPSLLFRAGSAAECCVWLKIVSHADKPIGIVHVGLQLPFSKEQFAWLEDPLRVTKQPFYRLPFSRDVFSRNEVINHRLRKKLLPGVPTEGFLLGVLQQPIPERVAGHIIATFQILDRTGRGVCEQLSLYIDTRVFRSKSSTPASLKLGGTR